MKQSKLFLLQKLMPKSKEIMENTRIVVHLIYVKPVRTLRVKIAAFHQTSKKCSH